jgi:hypothetical protein
MGFVSRPPETPPTSTDWRNGDRGGSRVASETEAVIAPGLAPVAHAPRNDAPPIKSAAAERRAEVDNRFRNVAETVFACAGRTSPMHKLFRSGNRAVAIIMLSAACSLAGCGGREVRPVAEQSVIDDRLSCEHLQGEYLTNASRLQDFSKERRERNNNNAGMILMAPLVASTLLFVDL